MDDFVQDMLKMEGIEMASKGQAPRVTLAQIEAEIESEHYFTALQGARMEAIDYLDKMGQVTMPAPHNHALGLLTF